MPSTPKVLIAEDHPINRKLTERMLEALGYAYDVVGNGLEVLEAIKSQSYGIVLMDLDMPQLDGLEATRRIRSQPEYAVSPRIIALTASYSDRARIVCMASGMNEFLGKPLMANDLKNALEGRRSDHSSQEESALLRRLEELKEMGGAPFVDELAKLFITEGETRLRSVSEAVAAGDLSQANQLFHQMQGSSSNLGASQLYRICLTGEEASQKGDAALASGCARLGLEELAAIGAVLSNWQQRVP